MHAALIANSACAPWLAAACRMTWPDSYKALAGWVWRAAHGRLSSAVRAFRNQVAAAKMELPRDVAQYVAIWGPRLRDDCQLCFQQRGQAQADQPAGGHML